MVEFKEMKCPGCGAELVETNSPNKLRCEYCGKKVILSKPIDNTDNTVNLINKSNYVNLSRDSLLIEYNKHNDKLSDLLNKRDNARYNRRLVTLRSCSFYLAYGMLGCLVLSVYHDFSRAKIDSTFDIVFVTLSIITIIFCLYNIVSKIINYLKGIYLNSFDDHIKIIRKELDTISKILDEKK